MNDEKTIAYLKLEVERLEREKQGLYDSAIDAKEALESYLTMDNDPELKGVIHYHFDIGDMVWLPRLPDEEEVRGPCEITHVSYGWYKGDEKAISYRCIEPTYNSEGHEDGHRNPGATRGQIFTTKEAAQRG